MVTSVTNALGVVLIAKGMKGSKPIVAAFYSVAVQAVILTAILLTRLPQLNIVAVGFFVMVASSLLVWHGFSTSSL